MQQPTSKMEKYNWTDHTVLIAEDDPMNFKYLSLVLEKKTGIQIVWAKDGLEAYQKIINLSIIDVVLLDLQLPELTGLDVLVQAKKIVPKLPVIMQTANSLNNEEAECYKAGCDAFFTKPLQIGELLAFMDNCIKEYSRYKFEKQIR